MTKDDAIVILLEPALEKVRELMAEMVVATRKGHTVRARSLRYQLHQYHEAMALFQDVKPTPAEEPSV